MRECAKTAVLAAKCIESNGGLMERRAKIQEVRNGVFLIDDAGTSTGYLVVGSERACMIDTMNGEENLYDIVRELTDKPVFVINTHGHPDHIFGNVFFDTAYMNEKDIPMAKFFTGSDEAKKYLSDNNLRLPEFQKIKEGDTFDLGGRTLVTYELPGHTPGGILLLLKEDRILFTGDAVNHHLWMQVDGALPLKDALKEFDRILFLENEADVIYHGHAREEDDISLLRCVRDGIEELVNGNYDGDEDYHYFGGDCYQHHFKLLEGKKYSQEHSVIVYNR